MHRKHREFRKQRVCTENIESSGNREGVHKTYIESSGNREGVQKTKIVQETGRVYRRHREFRKQGWCTENIESSGNRDGAQKT